MKMLPFSINDVVDILGIRRLTTGSENYYVVCPYCGDKKGKANVAVRKGNERLDVFHCYHCGGSANMLTLYMDIKGYDKNNKEARINAIKEIKEKVGIKGEEYKAPVVEAVPANPKADVDVLDKTYRTLLSHLVLSSRHIADLKRRGLTDNQIRGCGFKSVSLDTKALCRTLIKEGCTLKGVPGFFINQWNEWDLNFYQGNQGYLCPVFDNKKRVAGFQIRVDTPKDKRKYLWLSSSNKTEGTSSGSPVTILGDPKKGVIITEGILKATILYCFTKKCVIGVAGVNNKKAIKEAISLIPEGVEVIEAYDMDKKLNPTCANDYDKEKCKACTGFKICPKKLTKLFDISRARNYLLKELKNRDFKVSSWTWDTDEKGFWNNKNKGIDDYYLSRRERGNND